MQRLLEPHPGRFCFYYVVWSVFSFKSAVSSVEVDIFRCDKNQKSQNDAVSMHIGHLHTDLTCIAIHTNNLMNKCTSLIIII